jgi:transposase
VAREFGLARNTVRKMLEFSEPPGYQRQKPVRRPKLGPWQGVIDAILEDDKQQPKKQRHTAKRIFDRLRAEHAFTGGYTIVKDYVREKKLRAQEVFVPLTHQPGEAQADFGEAVVVIAGVEQKAHFMVFDLPHSDDCFLRAYPAETTEALLDAHVHAFQYFNGVPSRILYDNTKIAVAQILGNGARKKTRAFTALQSHYLFAKKFGRPAKGNDKGNVEGLVGYARRNFMVPIPRFASWDAFNEHLVEQSRQRRDRRVRGHSETIAVRFQRDAAAFLPLPAAAYEACEKVAARVSSLSLVRYRTVVLIVSDCRGSIPACAGEPCPQPSFPRRTWVYPRVCGGAPLFAGTGTITATVSDTTAQVHWGQGSTPASLATAINAESGVSGVNCPSQSQIATAAGFVTACASGATVALTSVAGGPDVDWTVTASAVDTNPTYFSASGPNQYTGPLSFNATPTSMTGGETTGSALYSFTIPDQGGYAANGNLLSVADTVTGA